MNGKKFVSDLFYLPSVDWNAHAIYYNTVYVPHAPYSKKYHLNKTNFVSAVGIHSVSIPLQGGRNQRIADDEIVISEAENWRNLHLKTIKSMYGRAPFFENIFPYFQTFYQQKFTSLYECNLHSILLLNKILRLNIDFQPCDELPNYQNMYLTPVPYAQVFADKMPFVPHASMLDLLMNEGKNSISILHQMAQTKMQL